MSFIYHLAPAADGKEYHTSEVDTPCPTRTQVIQNAIEKSKLELSEKHNGLLVATKKREPATGEDIAEAFELIGKKLSNVTLTGVQTVEETTEFLENVNSLYHAISSNITEYQTNAMRKIKDFLCTSDDINERAEYLLSKGFLNLFSLCLDPLQSWELNYETCWSITNFAAGKTKYTKAIVKEGLVPHLVALLSSENGMVRTQAAWALGNIAGDCAQYRDVVLAHDVVLPLISIEDGLFDEDKRRSMALHVTAWTIGNLCRYKNFDWTKLQLVYPFIRDVLVNKEDLELISECCWAMQRIFNDRRISAAHLIDHELCDSMVKLLKRNNSAITTPVLKAITNILSTDDDLPTQFFLDRGILQELCRFLVDGIPNIKLESLFVLSNIAAGTPTQLQYIIDHGLVSILAEIMQTDSDFKLRREACWTISNLVKGGEPHQIRQLAEKGCLEFMIQYLYRSRNSEDQSLLKAADSVIEILKSGEVDNINVFVEWIQRNEVQFEFLYESYDYLRKKTSYGEWSKKANHILELMIKRWFLEHAMNFEKSKLGFSHLLNALEKVSIQ